MVERCDVIVIGAGVVGLAVGRALACSGREVLVLERHGVIGSEISSRNSEVIHAGIYYPTGSLKAMMCVRGKQLLYDHCVAYNIPHQRIGKIIVATKEDQLDILRAYQRQARENGVGELQWLSREEILDMEPDVDAQAGVYSASTGIIDSHTFMISLIGDIESNSGMISYLTPVTNLEIFSNTVRVACGNYVLDANLVVNAAGLGAPYLAGLVGGHWRSYYAKGHYYALSGRSPFQHLVYPVAGKDGLGVHVTLDLAGRVKFGPDVVWQDDEDYSFGTENFERFVEAIRLYYPGLDKSCLHPSYTGIRPKLVPPGVSASDFVIEIPSCVGAGGLVNLLGIESPGLTASLAIAERVEQAMG